MFVAGSCKLFSFTSYSSLNIHFSICVSEKHVNLLIQLLHVSGTLLLFQH